MTIPRILVIAGSDSGGGAGIQADIKTITMLGGHAMTAITAITAQNTLGVSDVLVLPPDLVENQILAVTGDIGLDAIKLGMLGNADIVRRVADLIAGRLPKVPVVFDPVMVATSGDALNEQGTAGAMTDLLRLATVATPNLPELEALTGRSLGDEAAVAEAALELARRHGCAVLAKGGHLPGEALTDCLVTPKGVARSWNDLKIDTRHTHGTGCTLASGIAAGLAAGMGLEPAIARARAYVRAALLAAPGLGAGHGPMGHSLGIAAYDRFATDQQASQ